MNEKLLERIKAYIAHIDELDLPIGSGLFPDAVQLLREVLICERNG